MINKDTYVQESAFEKIGIGSAFESFCVFLLSGFLVVSVGSIFVDLTSSALPKWYFALIEEPISMAYFFILSILSLIASAIATKFGTKNRNGKWWFEKIILAPSRAGISCGFIASGMLIGIGGGLFIVTLGAPESSELVNMSIAFIALGVYCLAIAYPVSLFMLYLINQNTKHNLLIDLLGGLYIALVIFLGYRFKEYLDWVNVGAFFALLIIIAFFSRNLLKKAKIDSSKK